MATTFYVKAKWDEEAKVYYSETNVPGLNIEADTLKSFLELAEDLAPQMLQANLPAQSDRLLTCRRTSIPNWRDF